MPSVESFDHDSAWADLRTVLEFFGVQLDVQHLSGGNFRVSVKFRCGTVHHLILDTASLLVRRSTMKVLASVMNPAFYQAFSSRLNHRWICNVQENRVDFETPRIVLLSDSSDDEENDNEAMAEDLCRKRIIPLPYREEHEDAPIVRKRPKTVAALLGDTEYFVCKHCFKSFSRRSNMMRHIDRMHCERVVFACPQCQAVYKHAFHFADHLRGHEEEPQFACDNCEKRFCSRNQLRAHSRRNCKEPTPRKSGNARTRRSRQHEPQFGGSSEDGSSSGRFHIPYDFPVTL